MRGYLPSDITLRAVVRVGGTWTQHARYGWQIQARTLEIVDHLDRRGVVAFLVAYTTHLGPVRAADAVGRFGDRVFEVIGARHIGRSGRGRCPRGRAELYNDECLAAERLAELLAVDDPLFKPGQLGRAIKRAEKQNQIVLEDDQQTNRPQRRVAIWVGRYARGGNARLA